MSKNSKCYPSHNRYEELLRYLHFENNDSINAQDNFVPWSQVHPFILMVQDKFVRIEPGEYNSVVEQIIPLKTKYLYIRE